MATLREQMIIDASNIINNTDEFGREILYNDVPINTIPEIGESFIKGTVLQSEGDAEKAYFTVLLADVPSPKMGDTIELPDGQIWYVARISYKDYTVVTVECTANEGGF